MRGASFDIPGEQVDGMDVVAWSMMPPSAPSSMRARAKARYILEMLTYRYRGHSMSDPAKYRSRTRSTKYRQRTRSDRTGPCASTRSWPITEDDASKEIETDIRAVVTEAARFRHQ